MKYNQEHHHFILVYKCTKSLDQAKFNFILGNVMGIGSTLYRTKIMSNQNIFLFVPNLIGKCSN